jgi:hypothetical protein
METTYEHCNSVLLFFAFSGGTKAVNVTQKQQMFVIVSEC